MAFGHGNSGSFTQPDLVDGAAPSTLINRRGEDRYFSKLSSSTVLGLLTWCKLFFINIFREL